MLQHNVVNVWTSDPKIDKVSGVEKMTVTLIDANHCAGAVMFLFQGYFGCILYTGDFRYFDGMLDIPPFTNDIVINTLYLDNTYCDPKCEFPSRAEAKEMILQILHNNPDKNVVFGMDKLGKEELLYEVAKDQNTPIFVDEFRYKTAELLGLATFFTTNCEESHIMVTGKRTVNRQEMASLNMDVPTIGILPTCLFHSTKFANCNTIFVVPYSDHSSFTELKRFVAEVKPQHIIPVVSKFKGMKEDAYDRTDMSIFAAEISHDTEAHVIDIPSTVVGFMSRNQNGNTDISTGKKRKASTSYFNGKSKRACGIVFSSPQKEAAVCEDKKPVPSEQDTNISEGLKPDQIDKGTDVGSSSSMKVQVDNIHTERAIGIRMKDENDNDVIVAMPMVGIISPDKNQTHSQLNKAKYCECLSQLHLAHKGDKQDETQLQSIKLEVCSDKDEAQITTDEQIVTDCPTVSLEPTESQKTRNSVPLVVSTSSGDEITPFTMKSIIKICNNNDVGTQKSSNEPVEVDGLVHITSLPDNDPDHDQDDDDEDELLSLLAQAMTRSLTPPSLKNTSLPNGNTCEVLKGFESKLDVNNIDDMAQNTDSEPHKKDANNSERCAFTRIDEQDEKNHEGCENSSCKVFPQVVDDQRILHGSSNGFHTVCLEPTDSLKSPNSPPMTDSTPNSSGIHCHEKNLLDLVKFSQGNPEDLQLNTYVLVAVPPECLGSPKCTSAQSEICTSNTEIFGDTHQEEETEQGLLPKENILDETSENQVKLKQSSEIQYELIDHPLIPLIEKVDDPQITENKNSNTHQEEAPKFAAESDDKQITMNEDANTQELGETNEFQKGAFEQQATNLMPLPVIEQADSTSTHSQEEFPYLLSPEEIPSDDTNITHISNSPELSESEMSEEYPLLSGFVKTPASEKAKSPQINKVYNAQNLSKSQIDEFGREKEALPNPAKRRKIHLDKKTDIPAEITHSKVGLCRKCKERHKRLRREKRAICTETHTEKNADEPQTSHTIASTAQAPSGSQSCAPEHQDAGQGVSGSKTKRRRRTRSYSPYTPANYDFAREYIMERMAKDSK